MGKLEKFRPSPRGVERLRGPIPGAGARLFTTGHTPAVPASGRLSITQKFLYGAPSFAGAAVAIPILIHMPKFYSDVVLVPVGWIAMAIALARGLDAVTDPAMGWLSDRTRTRFGRRRPWIAIVPSPMEDLRASAR